MMERVAVAIHRIHGSIGLFVAASILLALGIFEALLPGGPAMAVLVIAVFVVLVVGAATLPREGVALEERAIALAGRSDVVRRLLVTAAWPALICLLLQPRIFLGAYGVPHLSPLTGVVLPALQQQITHIFLFGLLWLMVAYLRQTRHYALGIKPLRPVEMRRRDAGHNERDALLWMGLGIVVVFGLLLRSFWEPFSLIAWPPSLASLTTSRGVAGIAFALTPPLILFTSTVGHAALLRHEGLHGRKPVLAAATLHVGLSLLALSMHAYNLLWLAQYRAAARF